MLRLALQMEKVIFLLTILYKKRMIDVKNSTKISLKKGITLYYISIVNCKVTIKSFILDEGEKVEILNY
jgi:hypothetical protein